MEDFMTRRRLTIASCALIVLMPTLCAAQSDTSRLWIVAGGASATTRGDCQTCEADYPYRNGGGILGNIGYRVNPRMDIGMEVFWVPMETDSGTIRTTHFDAVAQFRPWQTHGFFFKGGAGMAFVRNWVDILGTDAINSKALSVVVERRMGVPHGEAGRLANVCKPARRRARRPADERGEVPDVMGNYWSIGAALVFR